MKSLSRLTLLSLVLPLTPANAHYTFGRLILDGKWTDTWEYIREISASTTIDDPATALVAPLTEPKSTDIICGRNASIAWKSLKTATVQAGGRVGFGAGKPQLTGDTAPPSMYHPGFASAWISKASNDDLDGYSGQNGWAKILQTKGRTEQSIDYDDPFFKRFYDQFKSPWGTFRAESWNFTIPAATPPGKYLLRFEHIFPNRENAQFYVNCAHVNIVAPDTSSGAVAKVPSPMVEIPGVYTRGQPDVYFAYYDWDFNITTFVPPWPPVWSG